jgi:hypothetical protein
LVNDTDRSLIVSAEVAEHSRPHTFDDAGVTWVIEGDRQTGELVAGTSALVAVGGDIGSTPSPGELVAHLEVRDAATSEVLLDLPSEHLDMDGSAGGCTHVVASLRLDHMLSSLPKDTTLCEGQAAECPPSLPDWSVCEQPGLRCTYGCTDGAHFESDCTNGVWQTQIAAAFLGGALTGPGPRGRRGRTRRSASRSARSWVRRPCSFSRMRSSSDK